MNWSWEDFKELARVVYARGAQLMVFLLGVFYLLACVIAEQPIGPKTYVQFAYHVFQWVPGQMALSSAAHPAPSYATFPVEPVPASGMPMPTPTMRSRKKGSF